MIIVKTNNGAKFVFKKKRNTLSMSLSIFALWLTPQSRLSG